MTEIGIKAARCTLKSGSNRTAASFLDRIAKALKVPPGQLLEEAKGSARKT
ncbi:MAG: hypothetical protein KDJ45_00315 [Hyphomicrobiaceae bacterium]|nr:hypothetical protein [Hyphomicrobiaceae bacterium]MCC0009262.1 hypothetical protein [Hyphomicrobiaceae bacterium]